jgi:hypothetical protein
MGCGASAPITGGSESEPVLQQHSQLSSPQTAKPTHSASDGGDESKPNNDPGNRKASVVDNNWKEEIANRHATRADGENVRKQEEVVKQMELVAKETALKKTLQLQIRDNMQAKVATKARLKKEAEDEQLRQEEEERQRKERAEEEERRLAEEAEQRAAEAAERKKKEEEERARREEEERIAAAEEKELPALHKDIPVGKVGSQLYSNSATTAFLTSTSIHRQVAPLRELFRAMAVFDPKLSEVELGLLLITARCTGLDDYDELYHVASPALEVRAVPKYGFVSSHPVCWYVTDHCVV